jgi:transcriptional regulator
MNANNFATLVSVVDGEPTATHLPLSIAQDEDQVVLRGHFAKANPQWKVIEGQSNLVMFTGPHAYVSPQHYEKVENVPTWNYIAVHAYGRGRLINTGDTQVLEDMMAALIGQHEPTYQAQWDGLSEKYRSGMLNRVVAFEIVLERIEGKFKLSQNRRVTEQENVAQALLRSAHDFERTIGTEMRRHLEGLHTVTTLDTDGVPPLS